MSWCEPTVSLPELMGTWCSRLPEPLQSWLQTQAAHPAGSGKLESQVYFLANKRVPPGPQPHAPISENGPHPPRTPAGLWDHPSCFPHFTLHSNLSPPLQESLPDSSQEPPRASDSVCRPRSERKFTGHLPASPSGPAASGEGTWGLQAAERIPAAAGSLGLCLSRSYLRFSLVLLLALNEKLPKQQAQNPSVSVTGKVFTVPGVWGQPKAPRQASITPGLLSEEEGCSGT